MSIATLSDIIAKVRRLTGSGNSFQLTDAQIIDYINSFYLYDLPAQFRSLKLEDRYTFNTIRGIDTYAFDDEHYTTIGMPCYCAKREIKLFQDPWSFYGVNFNWQTQENVTQGNGTTGIVTGSITGATQTDPVVITSNSHGLATGDIIFIDGVIGMIEINGQSFTITVLTINTFSLDGTLGTTFTPYIGGGTWSHSTYDVILSAIPIIRSTMNNPMVTTNTQPTGTFPAGYPTTFPQTNISRVQNILITANTSFGTTLNVTDDGAGNLIGDCTSGFIDYESGQISVLNFTAAVPSGENINVQYNPTTLSIPLSILFYANQFTLRPVPDKGYTIELMAYRQPSQVLLGSTDPDAPNLSGISELREWWELLAVGASKKVYEDRLDPDGVGLMDKMLAERYSLAYTRTYAQLGGRRVNTIYADQITGNYGASGWGFGNQGV